MDWSLEEVEVIVADYLHMLTLELSGQRYNKAEHNRRLREKLLQRSPGSVEFKHCNISAVMIDLGFPAIRGYQPRGNYQSLLAQVVSRRVNELPTLDDAALSAVQQPASVPVTNEFSRVLAEPPARQIRLTEPRADYFERAVKRDYLERETRNRSLGLAGEEFVLQFERWRLTQQNLPRLAECVEHVSRTRGDGLGFDVLSFDFDGRERLIEVKTTAFAKETPFFVTDRELSLSNRKSEHFHLYRLYDFRSSPRLFDLCGQLERHCQLDPTTYRASFG